MTNDSKKPNNDEKNTTKKNSVSIQCKPCMPLERNGNNKEKCGATKNPSTNQTSNVSSCYAKCSAPLPQQHPSSASTCAMKTTAKPSDQVNNVGSCYARCGPPSVQPDSSSASNEPTSTSCKSNADTVGGSCNVKPLNITNPFIEKMEEDILYHIALGNKSHDLLNMFGDIKFVVMGSTPKRMEQFAYFMASQMKYELAPGTILNDISKNSHRYAMFKVGPVLSVSHGMGTPSIGILIHELIKLMSHAGIKDPTFVRIGTCGGFNKKAGTVVVSNKVVNDFMEPFYELAILGKKVRFPANLDQTVVKEIISLSEPGDQFETIAGATYCTDNFYEGSGRADGAICEYSETESLNYYKELQQNGVVNVEMESLAFAALTCRAGIKSAVITVILSDRLETDQIKQSKEVLDEWQTRPQKLLAKYIKKKLSIVDLSGGATSTTKFPSCSSTTNETSTFKSCGGTGTGADSYSAQSTNSAKPPANACTSCGTNGKVSAESIASKPGICPSSTLPLSDLSAGKSCGGFAKENSSSTSAGTSTTKPITSSCAAPSLSAGKISDTFSTTSKPCGSCQGSGKASDSKTPVMQSLASTTSSPDMVVCKCCGGAGVVKASSTVIPSGSVCQPCTKIPNEDGQKVISATSAPNICKPCTPSKSNESSTTTAPSFVCKPCTSSASTVGGSCSGSTTSTPGTGSSSVCKPCGGIGSSTTTSSPSVGSSSVCKPCIGIGSSTSNTASGVRSSSVCKPCVGIRSSTTSPAPGTKSFGVCKPCGGIGSSTTSPAPGTKSFGVCKPCGGIGSSTTSPAPGVGNSNVCKPCVGIGSSTTTSGCTTSAPCQAGLNVSKLCESGSTSASNGTSMTTKDPGYISVNECKPCVGSSGGSTTDAPGTNKSATNAKTIAQSINKESVCKPCGGVGSTSISTGGTSTSKPACSATTASSQSNSIGVCKPCEGSVGKNGGTTTTTQSGILTEGKCKQNESSPTLGSTGAISTSKPFCNPTATSTSSSQSELSTGGVCKPCGGVASTTTGAPASSTTTSQSGFSTDGSCNQNVGSTTPGTSICKLGSNGATTQTTAGTPSQPGFSTNGQCNRNEGSTTSLGTTTRSTSACQSDGNATTTESFVEKICRRNNGGTMPTHMSRDLTTTTPGVARSGTDSNSVGPCKPCSGGSIVGPSSGTTTPGTGLGGGACGATTPASGLSGGVCGATTPAGGLTSGSCGATTASETSTNTCGRNTTSTAPDVTTSATSRLSAECATSNGNSNATTSNATNTTERKRSKCVPHNCYTADKTDPTPLPTTPKTYLAKDFDSSSNSTISNDSWRSCYQKCSSQAPTCEDSALSSTCKSQTFQTPEQDNFKGVPPALGPCCTANSGRYGPVEFREVPDAKGPCCASLEAEADSNDGQCTTTESTPVERRKSFFEVKTESTSEMRPSSDLTTTAPNTNQVVDTKVGPCCTGRATETTSLPISSNGSKLGPCCPGQSTEPQDITTSRPLLDSQSCSPICSGKNLDDSPDEPCGGSKSYQGTSITPGPTDSKSNALGPIEGNIQGCPISIGGPCAHSKDNSQSQGTSGSKPNAASCDATASSQQPQNSTPKPSPDTPDTSVTRAMPAFVTPTPPSTKGIICCSKFINSGSVLVTSGNTIIKEANRYDESPSPCATCKKFQEGKTRSTGSTPSDSQPEIIKCPHKLKRLKDECQGYD